MLAATILLFLPCYCVAQASTTTTSSFTISQISDTPFVVPTSNGTAILTVSPISSSITPSSNSSYFAQTTLPANATFTNVTAPLSPTLPSNNASALYANSSTVVYTTTPFAGSVDRPTSTSTKVITPTGSTAPSTTLASTTSSTPQATLYSGTGRLDANEVGWLATAFVAVYLLSA